MSNKGATILFDEEVLAELDTELERIGIPQRSVYVNGLVKQALPNLKQMPSIFDPTTPVKQITNTRILESLSPDTTPEAPESPETPLFTEEELEEAENDPTIDTLDDLNVDEVDAS